MKIKDINDLIVFWKDEEANNPEKRVDWFYNVRQTVILLELIKGIVEEGIVTINSHH